MQVPKFSGSLKEPVMFLFHHQPLKPAKPIIFNIHEFKIITSILFHFKSNLLQHILNLSFSKSLLFTNTFAKKRKPNPPVHSYSM